MSDADRNERALRRSEGGVSVVKRLERDAFPVPAVAFELHAERDTPATVRLVDPIPASVSANDIGFHAEYGAEQWAIENDTAVFERQLRPGEEHTTFYGVRGADVEDIESALPEPKLEITPPLEPDAPPANDGSSSADSTPPPDDASTPTDEPPPTDGAVAESDGLSIAGSVAGALATELRRGSVAEADRASLREEFDFGTDPERVEALVADIDSQSEALEAILGEDGTLNRRLERVSEEAGALQNQVADIDERSAANEETAGTLDDEVARLSGDVDAVNDEIDRLSDEVRTVEQTLTERLDALDERFDALSADVNELTSWRERMGALFAGETTGSDETAGDGADGNDNDDGSSDEQ